MPRLTIYASEQSRAAPTILNVDAGVNLRRALLDAELSPYVWLTRRLNCGGHGLCATCGVWVIDGRGEPPPPQQWHDWLAARYGYPRLSCQLTVDRDLTVYLIPDKRIWGQRRTVDSGVADSRAADSDS